MKIHTTWGTIIETNQVLIDVIDIETTAFRFIPKYGLVISTLWPDDILKITND